MLVFLMLLGTVLCSSVPLTTYRRATSEKDEKLDPYSSTSPFRVEAFHSFESDLPSSLTQNRDEVLQVEAFATGNNHDVLKSDISHHHPEDERRDAGLIDTTLKRADRLPRNLILPPLILAHHSSDISLEPTEVEAPGTTPTTLSMITESTVHVVQNSTNKPLISQLISTDLNHANDQINKKNSFDIKEHDDHLKSADVNSSKSETELNNEHRMTLLHVKQNDENITLNLELDKDMDLLDSILQKDHPTNGSNDTNNKFKIKALNNTYTLVHEKTDSLSETEDDDKSYMDPKTAALRSPLKYGEEIKEGNSRSNNENKNPENSELINRESKRIVTAAELLLNISNHRTLFDSIPSKTLNQNHKLKSSEIVIEEEKIQDDTFIDSVLIGTENVGGKPEGSVFISTEHISGQPEEKILPSISNAKNSGKSNIESSNIETREVDNDSFFILVNSEIAPKIVKKDDSDVPKSGDESRYRMDVITSSSEVTYKQFDPLKNSSALNINSDSLTALHNSPSEGHNISPRNSSSNSSSSNKNIAKELAIAVASSKERSLENNSTIDDQIVTSLPSQTSVVEPLRTNTSSALSEVTLPSSHHRTKSDQSASDSHAISSAVATDSVGRSPLGLNPVEDVSSIGDSNTPPVQQERISIPVAEHVSRSISAGCVVAIVSGVLLTMVIIGGSIAYFLYRRLEGFRPKILSPDRSCANSDSGGYLDDQCRVAYVNSQIDLPKSTPEDLVSLDNDSFLNSLESMTIQNLWTDSIRHTKLL